MPNFSGICIVSPNVGRLRDFYRIILVAEDQGDNVHAVVESPGLVLSLFDESAMEEFAPGSMHNTGRGASILEFEVENVDEEYNRLVNLNTPIVKAPTTYSWGSRAFQFRDPDGNLVTFGQRIS